MMRHTLLIAAVLGFASLARAEGALRDPVSRLDFVEETFRLAQSDRACGKGAVCFEAAGPATQAVLAEVAGATLPLAAPPAFGRAAQVASRGAALAPSASGAWDLDLVASFRKSTRPGTVMVMVFDASDLEALASRQFMAVYHADLGTASRLAAHVRFAPEDGFLAGKTYRVKLVQLLGRGELALAEGDVTLR